ncbi:fungal-specific transcription factor domain-containing protein [Talaromyces proteolyticus]|uniref:Fungal-specific transcription factor domain-containing protein n=1 Tax=Talaromyces proteolyticus TaxID=1131652 RepID=A0AAD4KVR1_9EURO|nr:fungal-specific transcription factor domain-containing protein [Talaromyces proteolyticus]KAH8700899.1 fungal-specific transcription factor domain-containing protein [Talaromyces proteolyticus]
MLILLCRSQHVRRLQTRLKQMEDLLRSAGIDPGDDGMDIKLEDDGDGFSSDDDVDYAPPYENESASTPSHTDSTPNSMSSPQSATSQSIPFNSALFIKSDSGEEPIYYGRASTYYILSRDGVQFIRDKTGEADWPNALFSQPCWKTQPIYWRSDVFADLFQCQVYRALPPRSEVFSLLKTYFRTINRIFPVFHEETFMRMVEWQYTQQDCTDVGRWASINALLALSYRYRHGHTSRPEKDTEKAWMYWKNAAAVLTELFLRRNDLLGVQTLLAMAIFVRVSGGIRQALPLTTAAIQSADALGLHRRNARPDLSPTEQEIRNRVWWCAFFLDQTLSIQTGMGNMQSADEFDLDLPSDDPDLGDSSTDWYPKWFRITCAHALLRRKIYCELYKSRAFYKTFAEVCSTVDSLNAELEEWKNQNPYLDFKPPKSEALDREQELEVLAKCSHILSYRHSLALINRMPLLHEVAIWRRLKPEIDPVQFVSTNSTKYSTICLQAARDSLKLLRGLPWRDLGYSWCLVDFLFVANLTIFSHVLRVPVNPDTASTEENLEMLKTAATYFKTVAPQDGGSRQAKFMATTSEIMERTARKVIDKAHKDAQAKPTEQQPVSTLQTRALKDKPSSNVHIPNVDGLPPVQSSGYFVPGEPHNEINAADIFYETADLAKMIPHEDAPLTAPYAWMLPDMFGPSVDSTLAGDTAALPFMDMPFATADYLGQTNLDVAAGDGNYRAGNGPAMNGDMLFGYTWNNVGQ